MEQQSGNRGKVKRQPVLFVGHGSPMNAIEDNVYTKEWKRIGKLFEPRAILVVSAHWYTKQNRTQSEVFPEKINDMYGFPRDLYTLEYPVRGDKDLTEAVIDIFGDDIMIDDSWGIDHGAWSVLVHMYPEANIPVVQLSVNREASPQTLFNIGRLLRPLRDDGVMILGSGNIVHNLRMTNFEMKGGYPWAESFDGEIEKAIMERTFDKCIHYRDLGHGAKMAVPTSDHYDPLLYVLGAVRSDDKITMFNKACIMGGISMTSYLFDSSEGDKEE